MCDHWKRSEFVPWKLVLLGSAIFAFFCYKRQLAGVGNALLEIKPEHTETTTVESKRTGSYEKIADVEFSLDFPGIEASSNLIGRAS